MATLKVPVSAKDHIWGTEKAFLTLVEYGDYQCPYCALAYPLVKQLKNHFEEQMRVVFRHFPITELHPYAEMAAEAAEFAASHDRFWEMHDLIYENQSHLNGAFLFQLAKTLELRVIDLERALEKRIYLPKIREQFLGGVRSGVNGTPTFFINDQRYNGALDYFSLLSACEALLVK